ncbi:hypothetical protein Xen7305DRAFT_00051780 [Xenococcus sp. PCC 7305]|uniref:class I SAM-dependent methyltransferase n=1 Tax=Xenococcus sp. PCC 7305 TaxID=102125 RepID=UPI0002ABE310|nr:class I SAM-dependent methyltransferase [Xenococcus sp. PCC 7305]ELS05434.1 hypothetical protein Xen7305DRAFT_00051780 [Xenococcus sp. PCC 7305]
MTNPLPKIAELIEKETPYTGGPIGYFECVGRDTFITLLQNGLRPDHKVLDLGCGALRLGYWIARFMDKGNYYGIEPVKGMLEAGKKYSLGDEIISEKQPEFSYNNSFDFSVFEVKFDFVVARSIVTHTTPGMFRKIIEQFAENGADESIMLASYWPTENGFPPGGENGDELPLDDWRFKQVIKYSFETISKWSQEFGVKVSKFELNPQINGQVWLKFEKSEAQKSNYFL